MPWGDGTGPWWAGENWRCRRGTGRGLAGNFGRGFGRGMGRGAGAGVGMGRGLGSGIRAGVGRAFAGARGIFGANYPDTAPQITKEDEISELKSYAKELEAELGEIKKRILSLGK